MFPNSVNEHGYRIDTSLQAHPQYTRDEVTFPRKLYICWKGGSGTNVPRRQTQDRTRSPACASGGTLRATGVAMTGSRRQGNTEVNTPGRC